MERKGEARTVQEIFLREIPTTHTHSGTLIAEAYTIAAPMQCQVLPALPTDASGG